MTSEKVILGTVEPVQKKAMREDAKMREIKQNTVEKLEFRPQNSTTCQIYVDSFRSEATFPKGIVLELSWVRKRDEDRAWL